MFGNNPVGSSWAGAQQNQQQPSGAFGQPSGFGTGGGAFGQSQQPQPQANPMFGNLSAPAANNSTTPAFGGFGTNTSQSNATNPIFGAPKPATGFGAFGTGSTSFGGGGAFGQSATTPATAGTTGVFGQPAPNTGAGFGSTSTGLFGNNKTTTSFGTAQPNSQTGAYDGVAPVTTGSSNPAYSVFTEKDSASNNLSLQYQAISCMPAYRGSSFEEIRLQDYAQGRKTAGTFGPSGAFGAPAQPVTTTTGLFGAPPTQNQPTNSIFSGANNQTTGAFGTFGQNNANPTTAPGAGPGVFGTFNQPHQQQPSTGFGTFGQNTQQQPQQPNTSGLFGSSLNAPKPAYSAFGGGGGGFSNNSAFGQPPQQQQQQQAGTTGTGLFGQSAPQTNPFGGFGASNNTNTAKPSIFGTTTQPATQPTTGFGLFGSTQQNQQGQSAAPQQPSGSLFSGGGLFGQQQNQPQQGQLPPNQSQPSGGLFGNPTQPAQQTSLFGTTPGGLFGNNQQQQQQQQQPNQQPPQQQGSFNLFGNKPATPTAQPSLFGSFGQQTGNTNTNNAPGQQSSLFGSTLGQPANPQPAQGLSGFSSSLFGKPIAPVAGPSQSFNASAMAPGVQGTLTASISQPVGANLPIFAMLPPGPHAITLDQQPKKKPGFFVDVPTRSPVPRLQLGYSPANTKLRGFGSLTSSSLGGPGNSLIFSSGKANALSLSRTVESRAPMGPDAFLSHNSSPSLGSGSRQSVKKLILDKKVEPSDLFSRSSGSPGSLRGKVTFSPALSVAGREKEAAEAAAPPSTQTSESPTPLTLNQRAPNRFTAHSTNHVLDAGSSKHASEKIGNTTELEEGEYWVKPDLETLKHAGYDELLAFKNLVVGRVGYGEIHFLDPVDLTGLPKLGELLGTIVRFDDKECSVYPDSEEVDKPPPGSGLNVRARLVLVRCWANDKATREPIKDQKHPSAIKHLKRLKSMKDTHFENFDIQEGKWTFTVDHF